MLKQDLVGEEGASARYKKELSRRGAKRVCVGRAVKKYFGHRTGTCDGFKAGARRID